MIMKENEQIFAYKRSMDRQTLYVICNEIPKNGNLLISNYTEGHSEKLRPYEAVVYEIRA